MLWGLTGKDLDVLVIVHLEIHQHHATLGLVQLERLRVPELLTVEFARRLQAVCTQTDVRDSDNMRTRRSRVCLRGSGDR